MAGSACGVRPYLHIIPDPAVYGTEARVLPVCNCHMVPFASSPESWPTTLSINPSIIITTDQALSFSGKGVDGSPELVFVLHRVQDRCQRKGERGETERSEQKNSFLASSTSFSDRTAILR